MMALQIDQILWSIKLHKMRCSRTHEGLCDDTTGKTHSWNPVLLFVTLLINSVAGRMDK